MAHQRRSAPSLLFCLGATSITLGVARGDAALSTTGRVRITELQPGRESVERVRAFLREALAAGPDGSWSDVRIASVRPRAGDPTRFDATIYDYDSQRVFELVVDADGRELSRRASTAELFATADEIEDARAIVARDPRWGKA